MSLYEKAHSLGELEKSSTLKKKTALAIILYLFGHRGV